MDLIQAQIKSAESEQEMYNDKKRNFSEKLQKAIDAEATLKAHSISSKEQLEKIKDEIKEKKTSVQKIPTSTNQNLIEIAQIDSHSKFIFESISKLEKETQGFDEEQFMNLKNTINEKQTYLSNIDQKLGAIMKRYLKVKKR